MKIILDGVGLAGILGTWGRALVDGTLIHLLQALHGSDNYVLPGTTSYLRKSFTGIYWPFDYLLDVLVIFFWEAVDGSHPATSTIGIYFLGQLFPVLVMNYCREGHGRGTRFLKPTLWLLSFQMCGLGCTGFLWALSFIGSSPTMSKSISRSALQSTSIVSPQKTSLILPALMIGYILPAIAMGLPSPGLVTNDFQQISLVMWNMFPFTVLGIFCTLAALVPLFSSQKLYSVTSSKEHLYTVRLVSIITIAISSATHIAVSAVSLSTILFPALFHPLYIQELHPASLALLPFSIETGSTVGDGIRSFFLWDQAGAYPIVILVSMLQLRTAALATKTPFSWFKSSGLVLLTSLTGGPGSACLAVSWMRDEILFASAETTTKRQKSM